MATDLYRIALMVYTKLRNFTDGLKHHVFVIPVQLVLKLIDSMIYNGIILLTNQAFHKNFLVIKFH